MVTFDLCKSCYYWLQGNEGICSPHHFNLDILLLIVELYWSMIDVQFNVKFHEFWHVCILETIMTIEIMNIHITLPPNFLCHSVIQISFPLLHWPSLVNHLLVFCQYRLYFLQFYINRNRVSTPFCVVSFTQHDYLRFIHFVIFLFTTE